MWSGGSVMREGSQQIPSVFVNGLGWMMADPRPAGSPLEGVVIGQGSGRVTARDIIKAAADAVGARGEDLIGRARDAEFQRARMAAWAAMTFAGFSLNQIARWFDNRDHTTILQHHDADPELVSEVRRRARELAAGRTKAVLK